MLQLIAFFEGIRPERQLMETVNVNRAHRWHVGYDLTEAVPDHSSLSKIRDQYGLATFQLFQQAAFLWCMQSAKIKPIGRMDRY
jgi:transposase